MLVLLLTPGNVKSEPIVPAGEAEDVVAVGPVTEQSPLTEPELAEEVVV